ncbi:hypothetical protein ACQRAW_02015 [Fusicatenibacter saccharivorans]
MYYNLQKIHNFTIINLLFEVGAFLFPNAGGIPKDRVIRSAEYRFTVHKEYLIFCLVDEEEKQVNVMAIFHAKKDYMHVMKKYI